VFFFAAYTDPRLFLSGQENVTNQMISTVEWEGRTMIKEKNIYLQNNVPAMFTTMQAKFTTLAEINNIYILSKVVLHHNGKTYNGLITSVMTTDKLEEVEIEMQITSIA
jgi:hypothetical protein